MLNDKLARWAELRAELDALDTEIKAEVMALGQTVENGAARATYSAGRGSYDYESMAMVLEPGEDVVAAHSKISVDWRKVCEASGATDDLKERFYKPGAPYVSLKLKG